jgi:hypothetical protein
MMMFLWSLSHRFASTPTQPFPDIAKSCLPTLNACHLLDVMFSVGTSVPCLGSTMFQLALEQDIAKMVHN